MLEEYKNVKGNEMESNYFKLFKFPLQFCFDFAISGFYVSETLKLKLQYCMFLLFVWFLDSFTVIFCVSLEQFSIVSKEIESALVLFYYAL